MAPKPEVPEELTEEMLLRAAQAEEAEELTADVFLRAQQAEELERQRQAATANVAQEAPEPIQIPAYEAAINSAANNVPFGRLLADIGIAGQRIAAPVLGRVLPDAIASRLPGAIAGTPARLTPQARAELEAMGEEVAPEPPPEPSPVDAYRNARDLRAARTALGAAQRPISSGLGTVAGIGLSALAPLGAFKAAPNATILGRALAAGKTGAAYGALAGLTDGAADLTRPSETTAMQAGGDVLRGAGTGGLFGFGAGFAIPAVRALYRGITNPSDAAKYLRSKGVPLTIGQMEPRSAVAQWEEAATSAGAVGPAIQRMRDASKTSWQGAVLDEARAPGMDPMDRTLPISQRMASIDAGFEPAYAPTKNIQMEPRTSAGVPLLERPPRQPAPPLPIPGVEPPPPRPQVTPEGYKLGADGRYRDPKGRFVPLEKLAPELRPPPKQPDAPEFGPQEQPSAFTSVVDDPTVIVDQNKRDEVRRFLKNQLTVLREDAVDGTVNSNALTKMRSNIRKEIRRKSDDSDAVNLLESAEDQVTDVIESSLPQSARDALRAADSQYRKFKVVEDAVYQSKDQPDGFTPHQLSTAIRKGEEKGRYTQGGGGELRDLAANAREVFDMRIPPTAARMLALGPGKYVFPPMALALNTPRGQQFMLGELPSQRALRTAEGRMAALLSGRVPHEAAARAALPEPEQPLMSVASPEQLAAIPAPMTEDQRRQLALSQAIQRLQGGRR